MFDHFCATLSGDTPKDGARMVHLPGGLNVNVALLNYAKWIREVCGFAAPCVRFKYHLVYTREQ